MLDQYAIFSFHSKGANGEFVDGSVHFLSQDIDLMVLLSLITRAGGEIIPGNAVQRFQLDSEDHVSRPLFPRRFYPVCLLALALPLAGCGGAAGRPQYQVHGKLVTKDGTPAAGAIVVLHPVKQPDAPRFPPRAVAGKDGVFVVGSRLSNDGRRGEYDVTLIWPEEHDRRNSARTPRRTG